MTQATHFEKECYSVWAITLQNVYYVKAEATSRDQQHTTRMHSIIEDLNIVNPRCS
jgi:hypothetical protein